MTKSAPNSAAEYHEFSLGFAFDVIAAKGKKSKRVNTGRIPFSLLERRSKKALPRFDFWSPTERSRKLVFVLIDIDRLGGPFQRFDGLFEYLQQDYPECIWVRSVSNKVKGFLPVNTSEVKMNQDLAKIIVADYLDTHIFQLVDTSASALQYSYINLDMYERIVDSMQMRRIREALVPMSIESVRQYVDTNPRVRRVPLEIIWDFSSLSDLDDEIRNPLDGYSSVDEFLLADWAGKRLLIGLNAVQPEFGRQWDPLILPLVTVALKGLRQDPVLVTRLICHNLHGLVRGEAELAQRWIMAKLQCREGAVSRIQKALKEGGLIVRTRGPLKGRLTAKYGAGAALLDILRAANCLTDSGKLRIEGIGRDLDQPYDGDTSHEEVLADVRSAFAQGWTEAQTVDHVWQKLEERKALGLVNTPTSRNGITLIVQNWWVKGKLKK